MKRLALLVATAALASACVSPAAHQRTQADADAWKGKALGYERELAARGSELETAKGELAAARSSLEALHNEKNAAADTFARVEADLRGKLAAAEEKLRSAEAQIESLKASVKDLQASSESSQSQLTKKVASLIAEKDGLAQKIAEAQKAVADLRAAKDAQIAELTQKLNAAIEEKTQLQQAKSAAEAAKAEAEKAKEAELARVRQSYEDLAAGLKSEIQAGEVKLTQLQGKLTVQLVDKILFDSGSDDIKPAGRKVLGRIGKLLNDVPDRDLRIEGHTDNVPISDELRGRFASNWELSTARATAVARYLQDAAKVDPKRLVAAGFGEYRPVASNDRPETRALNRRIEIALVARE
ncbi:MAG: OmpA family protein [Elusimicrobia bacterium]|nr:OmpA family protein [Elusimicrobiota bacterium]